MANLAPLELKRIDSVLRQTCGLILWLLLATISISAQTTTTTSTTDGMTPAGLAPGSPAGSYALSGFDNINPFNQSLNFRLPLMQIGGRGSAGYTMTLPIERKWHVEHNATDFSAPCPPERICETPDIEHTYSANDFLWNGLEPGYGPGVLQGRRAGSRDTQSCGGNYGAKIYNRTLTRLTFTASDGTEFELRDQLTGGNPLPGQCTGNASRGTVFVTSDGTFATFISDRVIVDYSLVGEHQPFAVSGYLLMRDGTRYRIDEGIVSWIRDRNGNSVHYEYSVLLPGGDYGTKITDSMGRVVTVTYRTTIRLYDEIIYKGFGGATRTIRVRYDKLYHRLRASELPSTYQSLFSTLYQLSTTPPPDQNYNPEVISAIELPDEQRRYNFYYNSYGELARVELPTGGAFEYDYQPGDGLVPVAGNVGSTEYEILRGVAQRRVYGAGGVLESRMYFGGCTTGGDPGTGNSCVQIDQKKPDGTSVVESTRHYYYGSPSPKPAWFDPLYYSAWNEGKEFRTETLAADATTVLRRVEQTWRQRATPSWWSSANFALYGPEPSNDPRVVETTTTLMDVSPHLVTRQSAINPSDPNVIGFDQFNNQTDVWEYDYGDGAPGPLVRHTQTQYLTTNPVNNLNYTARDTIDAPHLLSLPVQKSVYDVAGVEKARATFEYDNYTPDTTHQALKDWVQVTGIAISGLDAAYASAPTGPKTRGNVTSASSWLLQNGGATPISSFAQYDVVGNVVKTIDARGYATVIDFIDRFGSPVDTEARSNQAPAELAGYYSYALPTSVTNALGHTIYAQYDYYLGKVVDAEDANGVVSSAFYNDPLDRPTWVIRAANTAIKSQTTFTYDDLGHAITTTSDQTLYGDNLLKSVAIYDGLGRTVETRQYESATDYIATQQGYDALGRVSQSSNPYRPGEPILFTSTEYDALGRVVRVKTPDQAEVQTAYSGNLMLVTDQAGKQRLSRTDALGRLIHVWEIKAADAATVAVSFPGHAEASAGYLTAYGYDALDNLSLVAQGVQTRSFVYDSLKRLILARNPELDATLSDGRAGGLWSVRYDYDPNGNLKEKVDARGVVTTYAYDELNRVRTRGYSDGTPAVTYSYDTPGIANSIGRLTSVSSSVSVTSYTAFDAMGRVTSSQQATDSQTYSFPEYKYDLAGHLTSEQYPSGRVVATEYDGAGRVAGVRNQGSTTYYAGGTAGTGGEENDHRIKYAAHGAVTRMRLGNGLWENTSFNQRLQPQMIGLGTVQKVVVPSDLNRFRVDYAYEDNNLHNNNGNVLQQSISVPDTAGNYVLSKTQIYTYDELNRLSMAEEAGSWKQVYRYDRYGNRRLDSGTSLPVSFNATNNPDVSDLNNRITSAEYGYDKTGNLICDPDHLCQQTSTQIPYYSYDAENRIQTAGGEPTEGGARYSYDGDGRRVKKEVGNVKTIFVYDAGGQLVAEYSSASPEPGSGGTSYLTADSLGTPRVITDHGGNVRARHDYLPFGEEISVGIGGRTGQSNPATGGAGQKYVYGEGGDGVRQTFTGKERDDETGLGYFGARYYSSRIGRWTSPDWSETPEPIPYADLANPQSLNLYTYVYNNPLFTTDSDGHSPDVPEWLQRIWNKASGRGYKTDAELEAERREAQTRQAQEAARAAATLTQMGFDPNQISQLSNQQVIDFYNAVQNGEKSVVSEGARITIEIIASTPPPRTVIGKLSDLNKPGELKPGESTLNLPDRGSPRANWQQNAARLREAMREGRPIRDASVDRATGALRNNTGFLRAERNLLKNQGWQYNPSTRMWHPPGK